MKATAPKRGVFIATVVGNRTLCRDHFRLELAIREFPPSAPGQFVQVSCEPPRDSADEPDMHPWHSEDDPGLRTRSLVAPVPLLRRPFSLAGVRLDPADQAVTVLEVIGRAVGLGTGRLASMRTGDRVSVIGPLGNSFPLPSAEQTALLVGGGVGIPPMIYLAESLGRLRRRAVAIAGVTTADYLPLALIEGEPLHPGGEPTASVAEFARHGVHTVITSDDGTIGMRGLVTDALATVLERLALPPERLVVYVCGPEPMMRAVTRLAIGRGIRVWLAMERAMACGVGTCQSCVCKVRPPGAAEWTYKLVCTDGTIFDGREILWE